MRLEWTDTARADRIRIARTIAADSVAAAQKLDLSFQKSADRLLSYPKLGKTGRLAGSRELVAHQNYILICTIDDEVIRILTILHAAQRWP